MGHTFSPQILREYDIRGQMGKDLSADDAYALGQAFGTYVQNKNTALNGEYTICVGYDGRLSSPILAKHLCNGLKKSGVRVINVGLGPTPMLYFSVKHFNADAGIMVTGSHNPSDYNGFKLTLNIGPVFGLDIKEIGSISSFGKLTEGKGSIETLDIQDIYVNRLLKDLKFDRELTIAWDAGNGATGEILRRLLSKIPGTHHLLFDEIDGNFPNHHPDPTVDKNLADIQNCIVRKKCDLGIAFDGDGDRIGVVDENGTIVRGDMLTTIYASEVLKAQPGAVIIGDVKCSQIMFDEINRMGGEAVMWKTGHSLVKAKMKELNSPLAGELSGHIFFADQYYGYDDALYCAIRLLNILSQKKGDTISSLMKHIPKLHNTPELRIEVSEEEKFKLMVKIKAYLHKISKYDDTINLNDIDGIRVTTPDGWWLVRPSNTQNILVARIEAHSEDGLKRLIQMAKTALKEIDLDIVI